MPRFDGSGPLGFGPMTGRGMGPCRCGMGYGKRFYSKKDEAEILKQEAEALQEELEAIKERLSELEGQK